MQLLVNNKEQIFVEKLKSLLRFWSASTRFKDVFDMYYLSSRIRKTVLRTYMKLYIYDDAKMRESDAAGVVRRLQRIFANRRECTEAKRREPASEAMRPKGPQGGARGSRRPPSGILNRRWT